MTEPPRRSRFQIHLSTAIVLMFTAGGLIWANVNEKRIIPEWADNEPAKIYGWPLTALTMYSAFALQTKEDVPEIHYQNLWVDCATALTILIASWGACEWLFRRRTTSQTRSLSIRAPDFRR